MTGSICLRIFILISIMTISGCSSVAFLVAKYHTHTMLFKYEGQAQSVCLAGDFNKWSQNTHCLDKQNGVWSIQLMLPHGTHRYAFIINGKQWVVDPNALFTETDGFDRQNSVIVIN
ncbi:MAG: isoamylase early set domain-containing protein [Pseudomonadota bacterium]